jgi:hypothetical protein
VGGAAVSSILSAAGSLPGELAAAAGGSSSFGGGATLGFALFRMLDAMFQKDSFSCERGKREINYPEIKVIYPQLKVIYPRSFILG